MSIKDNFVTYIQKNHHANVHGTNSNMTNMMRSFKRVYNQTSVEHLIYFSRANAYPSDVNLLVAYMLGKGVVSVEKGVSVGTALKLVDRNDKFVSSFIALPKHRLLKKLKSLTSLFRSKNVTLSLTSLVRDLNSWESQDTCEKRNWVRQWWASEYCMIKKGESDVSE